eukprot:6350619-Ditylum_brightwellii.AAC.2
MEEMLAPYSNFILIASNDHSEEYHSISLMTNIPNASQVWSGDQALVQRVHDVYKTQVVLETMLNADDGLHFTYIEKIQQEATRYLVENVDDGTVTDHIATTAENMRWRVWCVDNRLEWHPRSPFPPPSMSHGGEQSKQKEESNDSPHGYLAIMHADGCVLSGMTFGYGVGSSRASIPLTPYRNDNHDVPTCGKQKVNCLRRMEKLAPAVIHPYTSASSLVGDIINSSSETTKSRMDLPKKKYEKAAKKQRSKEEQDMMWKGLEAVMHLTKDDIIHTKKYFEEYDMHLVKQKYQIQYQ